LSVEDKNNGVSECRGNGVEGRAATPVLSKAGNDGEKGNLKGLTTVRFARNITLSWTPFRTRARLSANWLEAVSLKTGL
jgi:hypothetical protein